MSLRKPDSEINKSCRSPRTSFHGERAKIG